MVEIKFGFNIREVYDKWKKHDTMPKNSLEKQAILMIILEDFADDRKYMESDVNYIIKKHFSDFAIIRREFVNYGYMLKDSYKGEYVVFKRELSNEDIMSNSLLLKDPKALGIKFS